MYNFGFILLQLWHFVQFSCKTPHDKYQSVRAQWLLEILNVLIYIAVFFEQNKGSNENLNFLMPLIAEIVWDQA